MQVIEILNSQVYISCPRCDNTENQPVEQQRKHLQNFHLLKGLPSDAQNIEISEMKCKNCNHDFKLSWDYENIKNR